jgi:hypothetical protein
VHRFAWTAARRALTSSGFQIECAVEGRNRLVEAPVHGEDIAQDLVQPVARGIERDRLPQQCLRLAWIAVQ